MNDPTFPVVEVFGPTIQGEGVDQGVPCYFIRFGGCDYACNWCDSPHAVLPELVRENTTRMNSGDIINAIWALPPGPKWVVLTGGNPMLLNLEKLVGDLHVHGYKVAVETQGSRHKDWVEKADRICVSPKPPSSGVQGEKSKRALHNFLGLLSPDALKKTFLKVVVFDNEDLDWAEKVITVYSNLDTCLSLGTFPEESIGTHRGIQGFDGPPDSLESLASRYRELISKTATKPAFASTRLHVQNHVLAFGHAIGV